MTRDELRARVLDIIRRASTDDADLLRVELEKIFDVTLASGQTAIRCELLDLADGAPQPFRPPPFALYADRIVFHGEGDQSKQLFVEQWVDGRHLSTWPLPLFDLPVRIRQHVEPSSAYAFRLVEHAPEFPRFYPVDPPSARITAVTLIGFPSNLGAGFHAAAGEVLTPAAPVQVEVSLQGFLADGNGPLLGEDGHQAGATPIDPHDPFPLPFFMHNAPAWEVNDVRGPCLVGAPEAPYPERMRLDRDAVMSWHGPYWCWHIT